MSEKTQHDQAHDQQHDQKLPRTIRVSDTLSGAKQTLTPREAPRVGLYACGVTVYDASHIGHAMQAVFFDVIRRYLGYAGYEVTYVRNYTDVDDKIIARAQELGIAPTELSRQMIERSEEDFAALGVREPDLKPKVSESIPEIIAMVETLVGKGAAYATADGDVYYKVRAKDDYGKLSNRRPDDLRRGERALAGGEHASAKEDELDFALWKADTTPGASWESPWGAGRPGWHIECSAMAKKYLGSSFEIHGGGRDLVFPHHENEIAQSESANDAPFANLWIHSGLLTIDHQKMSKSTGNFITITDFLKRWPAEVLRLGYLQNHYGSNINFSEDLFRACRRRLLYYYETLAALESFAGDASAVESKAAAEEREAFCRAMDEDFNTPAALAVVANMMRRGNQLVRKKKNDVHRGEAAALVALLRELGEVLSLFAERGVDVADRLKRAILPELGVSEEEIRADIEARAKARADRDWARSDAIRDQLLKRGICLMDGADGQSTWTIDSSSS